MSPATKGLVRRRRERSDETAARFLEMRCAIPVTIATRRRIQGWASTLYPTRAIDGEGSAADLLVRKMLADEEARAVAARMFAP